MGDWCRWGFFIWLAPRWWIRQRRFQTQSCSHTPACSQGWSLSWWTLRLELHQRKLKSNGSWHINSFFVYHWRLFVPEHNLIIASVIHETWSMHVTWAFGSWHFHIYWQSTIVPRSIWTLEPHIKCLNVFGLETKYQAKQHLSECYILNNNKK